MSKEGAPKLPTTSFEENPFQDSTVAAEWIQGVESEKGLLRDQEIYPRLRAWSEGIQGTILDIGAGQGIAAEAIELKDSQMYIGVEPSLPLIERATEIHTGKNREFVAGNAYQLPLENNSIDGCFSINVWFHLEKIEAAITEMARVLKAGGGYFAITVNPAAYPVWESTYFDEERDGDRLVGKVRMLTGTLSRNTFYPHSLKTTLDALKNAGLDNTTRETFGKIDGHSEDLFMCLTGKKQ